MYKVRRQHKKKKGKKNSYGKFFKIVFLVTLSIVIFIYLSLQTHYWDNSNKLAVATPEEQGYVNLYVFDPQYSKITKVAIPGDTQVEVARGLGTIRIKNVWQLGINEGIGGRLLSETITKNFKIPVITWAESGFSGYSRGFTDSLKALVYPYKSNLKFGDRLRIFIFTLGVGRLEREEIDLSETNYLNKDVLADGELGYRVGGRIPDKILVVASDNLLSQDPQKIAINNATGGDGAVLLFGELIEAMGAKVVRVAEMDKSDDDCKITGKNESVVRRLALLFNCKIQKEEYGGNYDVEILLGSAFVKRF